MVWRFYSGITGLYNTELLNCMLPSILVKSYLTKRRTLILLEYVYEAQNSKVCQLVGDHLCGNIDTQFSRLIMHAINYFLTQYNGESQVIAIYTTDWDLYKLCEAFENSKQLYLHNSNKIILKIPMTELACQPLLDLLRKQFPVDQLHITNLSVANLQLDVHWLSQLFTSSNSLCVVDLRSLDYMMPIDIDVLLSLASLRNVQLHHVSMICCHLGLLGADKISEMLNHNNSITSLNLTNNNIGDDGVESLVYHLTVNNKLQHLNLSNNNISAVGAGHLRKLITITDHPTPTSIELSHNYDLGDEGVHVILSSLIVTVEHIGLRGVNMTSSSSDIIAATLHKVKSISFDQLDDYERICDSLANTTVLKKLELGKVSTYNYLSSIGHNNSIEKLQLEDVTDECVFTTINNIQVH